MSPTKTPTQPRRTASPADAGGGMPHPVITPEQVATKPPGSNGTTGPGAPEMAPPGAAAQAAGPGGATLTSGKIGGLWTSDNATNAWAYLDGVGWRKLSPA